MTVRAAAAAVALALAATPSAAQPGHVLRVEHHDAASPPTRGPAHALVTIEVFFAPGPSAKTSLRYLADLQAKHPSRIQLVYRVVASSGQVMVPSALLEAAAQGKFFETLDAIEAHTGRPFDRAQLLELAGRLGLDLHRVQLAIQHGPDALDDNYARLRRVHRTPPEVLFNGIPLDRPLPAESPDTLEIAYGSAYDAALDLVDRGADPTTLAEAFRQSALSAVSTDVQISGDTDDDVDVEPTEAALATPPIDLAGLPSFGKPNAPIPIVLFCSPMSTKCAPSIDHAIEVERAYPEQVRVVWAPYYDVSRADAVDLGLLADAALCAETVGTSSPVDSEISSSGWRWVTAVLEATRARHGRHVPAQDAIDAIAGALRVDAHEFAACRAARAGSALGRIAAARHSGVRGAPTTMVGGRLYLRGFPDAASLQRLVEAELAPGLLGQLAPSWAVR